MQPLVFTDLDGSLLDHYSYDFSPALSAITRLNALQIPWILTSSKTASEILDLRQELGNNHPFIVENGAGIFAPAAIFSQWPSSAYCGLNQISLGQKNRQNILQILAKIQQQNPFNYLSFSQMTAETLAHYTGLSLSQAIKANDRHFTEPLIWQDTEEALDAFKQAIMAEGLYLNQGGRFYHLSGPGTKGLALKTLAGEYAQLHQDTVTTLALGDGQNDVPMLEAADAAAIIRSPVNPPPTINHTQQTLTPEYGPQGWNHAVHNWLDHLHL